MDSLITPLRFSLVEEGIYRGGYPTLRNYRFLKRLQLKTIISVVPEEPICDLKDFSALHDIELIHFKASKFNTVITITNESVCDILSILINTSNHPVYLHCLDGANITGAVIASLRILQLWTPASSLIEYMRYTRENTIEREESSFVNCIHGSVTILRGLTPSWLWKGEVLESHPTYEIQTLQQSDNEEDAIRIEEDLLEDGDKLTEPSSTVLAHQHSVEVKRKTLVMESVMEREKVQEKGAEGEILHYLGLEL